jgi:hypothetical protein
MSTKLMPVALVERRFGRSSDTTLDVFALSCAFPLRRADTENKAGEHATRMA